MKKRDSAYNLGADVASKGEGYWWSAPSKGRPIMGTIASSTRRAFFPKAKVVEFEDMSLAAQISSGSVPLLSVISTFPIP